MIQDLLFTFAGTLLFGIVLQIPAHTLLPSGLIGLAGRYIFLVLTMAGYAPALGIFVGALVIALLAEILARIQKVPVTIYLVAAIIPLVPGWKLYGAMIEFAQGEYEKGMDLGIEGAFLAIAIAAGIATVSAVARYIKEESSKKK